MALYKPTTEELFALRDKTGMGMVHARRYLQLQELQRRIATTHTLEELRDALSDTVEAVIRMNYSADPSEDYNVFARHAARPIGVIGKPPGQNQYVYWPTTARYLRSPEMREIADKIDELNR